MSRSLRGPILTVSVILALIIYLVLAPSSHKEIFNLPSKLTIYTPPDFEIPNIVHFVHFETPSSWTIPEPYLEFQFSHFLAIYSAYIYLKPDVIYIHTDAETQTIEKVKESTHQWTNIIANLPSVEFKHVVAPERTKTGRPIQKLSHKSDFIRTMVMKKYGGIYLDEDSYVLKDFAPLRRAGFRNVVGRQHDKQIGCAIFLSTPENRLINAYQAQQHTAFNGGWITHAVILLSDLVNQFASIAGEVLVLEQNAFFPLSWETKDLATLYSVNQKEVTAEWSYTTKAMTKDYKFSTSYAIHGFNSANTKINFGSYGGITLDYILAQTSNFARTVYPAVEHAMKNGIIPKKGS
jgi:mannosyltransferase OCH1-like enzyme